VSHDPLEIILICWFIAQETFIMIIINVENNFAAYFDKKNANLSHDPSEIILICWFVAQETVWLLSMLKIILQHNSLIKCFSLHRSSKTLDSSIFTISTNLLSFPYLMVERSFSFSVSLEHWSYACNKLEKEWMD